MLRFVISFEENHFLRSVFLEALPEGSLELLDLLADQFGWTGGFWDWVGGIDLNMIGFLIVGLFVLTWVAALLVWKYARVEDRWNTRLAPVDYSDQA